MPRTPKQRKGELDPHAFEFTGEEAIQADEAARARPTFRRQKLSILSALPTSPTPLSNPTKRSALDVENNQDSEPKQATYDRRSFNYAAKRVRHSLGVLKQGTKRTKSGREKSGSKNQRSARRCEAALEATIVHAVKREVTPEPPPISLHTVSQSISEASIAFRRSGRKRFRTTKALQVYEAAKRKPHTPKRRRSSPDAGSNIEDQRKNDPDCARISRKPKEEDGESLLKPEKDRRSDHKESTGLRCRKFEEVEMHFQSQNVVIWKDANASEMANESKICIPSEGGSSKVVCALSSAKIMSDSGNEDRSKSGAHKSSSNHCSPGSEHELETGERVDSGPLSSIAKPMITQQGKGDPSEPPRSCLHDSGISGQHMNENLRNNLAFQEHKMKPRSDQSNNEKKALQHEASVRESVVGNLEKGQDSNASVSPITHVHSNNDESGFLVDREVVSDVKKGKYLEFNVKEKETLAAAERQISEERGGLPNQAHEPTVLDGRPGSGSTRKPELNFHLLASPENNHEEAARTSPEHIDNAQGKPMLRTTISFGVPMSGTDESEKLEGDKKIRNCEELRHQQSEDGCHKLLSDTDAQACHVKSSSVQPSELERPLLAGPVSNGKPLKYTIFTILEGKKETESPGRKTDASITDMEIDLKSEAEGSTEKTRPVKPPLDIPRNSVRGESDAAPCQSELNNEKRLCTQSTSLEEGERQYQSVIPKLSEKGEGQEAQNGQNGQNGQYAPLERISHEKDQIAEISRPTIKDCPKSKQTFSKRVRFVEPAKSFSAKIDKKGFSDIMKMRLRKARCKQMTPYAGRGVTVMTVGGPGPDEKERRVFLDELQYILDGIFKPRGKSEQKSPQLESQLVSKTLISLTHLLMRKSREVKSTAEDESDSALIQILSTQPSLFRSIVSQLCGVFGKSRSVDAVLAVVFVLIFRATSKLLLIGANELDVLLNAFFRSSAAALKADEVGSQKKFGAACGNNVKDAKKRRGRLAKRFEESDDESSVLSALNKVVAKTDVTDEGFPGFENEVIAASHLIGNALSLAMCFHGNLRCLMRENRRLDKVVAVLYSCEKLLVQRSDSVVEGKKLQFVNSEVSTPWIVLGASLRVLEFAVLDTVCQSRTARESRICAIVVDVIRSVECLREGMFGSEWILSAAFRVAINLCHGFREASHQFVKHRGHDLALKWVAKECQVAGLLNGVIDDLCTNGVEQSFDVRVLCLALLATIVDQEQDVCDQFHSMNVEGFEKRNFGGLEIATQILQAAEASLEDNCRNAEDKDVEGAGRRRRPDVLAHAQHAKRSELMLENKITIGYASLLVGALVQDNIKNRELAEQLIPSNNLIGIAAVLTGFLEFHHEVGIISGSMDRMYARIINSLMKPFRKDTALNEAEKTCYAANTDGNGERDVSMAGRTKCT